MKTIRGLISTGIGLLAVVILAGAPGAHADVVTDANAKAADVVSRIPAPPITVRMMAIVQVSVFESVNAITGRYPAYRAKMTAAPGASVEAAVASATRTALLKLLPAQQTAIEADYQALVGRVPDGPAKAAGIAVGEQAANAIVALCADDGMVAPDVYRPHAAAGVYVPTVGPAVPHWGKRRPWAMTRGDQFRPGPPPSLTSDTWVRDYNEIKAIGSRNSTQRTPEQTAIAKFWEATAPAVYWPIARSVAAVPGREVTDNARLLAVAAMAMDDALIAVFDGARPPPSATAISMATMPPTGIRAGRRSSTRRCIPSIRALTASCRPPWAPCSRPRSAPGPRPRSAPPARPPGAPSARGRASATSRRRSRRHASTTACTTASQRRSVPRWARRSASWR